MEYWLSFNNIEESLQLPVPPSSFEISKGNVNTTININNVGEVNLIGKGKLATISISSFFPFKEYDFCQYKNLKQPYEYIDMIEKWRASGKPIRLIITETNINMAVAIENFSYGENDGTGDVYFTLELKEYRFLTVSTLSNNYVQQGKRRITKNVPKTYTVKQGDTLYQIAKKITGNSNNAKIIASNNNIKNINKIYIGQKLVI